MCRSLHSSLDPGKSEHTHTIKVFEQLFIVNNTLMYLKLNYTLKKDISAPEKHSQELSIFTKAKL